MMGAASLTICNEIAGEQHACNRSAKENDNSWWQDTGEDCVDIVSAICCVSSRCWAKKPNTLNKKQIIFGVLFPTRVFIRVTGCTVLHKYILTNNQYYHPQLESSPAENY